MLAGTLTPRRTLLKWTVLCIECNLTVLLPSSLHCSLSCRPVLLAGTWIPGSPHVTLQAI
jgi:hypothetical protein